MKLHERFEFLKKEILTEGKIVEIIKRFFLLPSPWPKDYTFKDILEREFDVDNRDITIYTSTKPFRVRGALLWVEDGPKVQGLGFPTVKPKTKIWVRDDKRNPREVDIQFKGGRGNKDQTFTIPRTEWERIRTKVRKSR